MTRFAKVATEVSAKEAVKQIASPPIVALHPGDGPKQDDCPKRPCRRDCRCNRCVAVAIFGASFGRKRELKRFQIQSFERFRREFTEDPNLRRLSEKNEQDLTDEEIDDYVGFFEEIGLYFHRGLVDVELVDEILGDYVMDAWEEPKIREAIGAVRGGEDDPSYFKHFEALARHLLKLKKQRTGA
jgi:hypothetical protein